MPKQLAVVTGDGSLEHISWPSAFAGVSHLLMDLLEIKGRY